MLVFNLNISIIVATVPTELQTGGKALQIHLSGGGGTPWVQPKSNVTFKLVCFNVLRFLVTIFGFKYFIIVATVPTALQTCAKVLQIHISGGGGTPRMQPKSNVTFKLA